MADKQTFHAPGEGGARKWVVLVLVAVVVIGVGWLLYRFLTEIDGIKVTEAPPTMVDMLPPPPPPPPPPPEPEKPPEPTEQPETPEPAPTPDKPQEAPMKIDGPAQAGSDSYGLQAGSGGGMGAPSSKGVCVGANCGGAPAIGGTDRFWGPNIARALEAHIERSKSVNVDSFVSEYEVWVSDGGTLTQARVVRSSGNSKLDQTVLALLEQARGLKPPPASIRMPQRVKVGRKRF